MMNNVGPPEKRPRHEGPPPPPPSGPWQPPQDTSRQLPSISHNFPPTPQEHAPPYQQHGLPFSSRPPEPPPHLADRRPSEHAPPPPWDHSDHRRPSSGPSHGYQPGPPSQLPPFGGPREATMVKRDPSEDTPQHPYRPNSTGHPPDHNVNAPHHEGPGRPFHPPSYEPPHARPQAYASYPQPHTGSPVSASNPYHPNYGRPDLPPPPEHQFTSVSYPPGMNRPSSEQVRKKAQRAAQACDSCRTLKAKCDEGRPSCSSCKEKNTECRYRDPPPKQQDKASADIMEALARMANDNSSFKTSLFDYLTNEISEVKRVQKHILQCIPNAEATFKEEAQEGIQMPMTTYSGPSVRADSQVLTSESPYGSTPGHHRMMERPEPVMERVEPLLERSEVVLDQMELPRPRAEDEEEEEGSGDPGPPKDSSIPINHTTGAARLLLLGPIAEMCKDSLSSQKIRNEKYPIQQETRRGMLRLFGRGEGGDFPPGYDKDPSTDHGEGTPGDAESNASTPPAGEEWGQLGGLTPPPSTPDITRGGISPEGMPDLSRETVYELVRSYLDNINIMHPILIPTHLHAMVETFLKNIPENQQAKPKQIVTLAGHAPAAGFLGGGGYRNNPESPGQKRKRSPVPGEYPDPHQAMLEFKETLKPLHPFRTINTAIVLLVMALGKICLWKGQLPEIVPEKDNPSSSWNSSPTMKNGHPQSPIQTSPMGIPSPQEMDRTQSRSRRTSIEGGAFPQRTRARNLDRMPGLAYFAFATDILGNQLGGNSLQHVHAYILAGLYHAQLARIMESSAYIATASRILQVILRPKLDRFKKLKAKTEIPLAKDNPLIFAFWTCLQLESDIVAELPCPHSGILTYEEDMPAPNLQAACEQDGFDQRIIESYSAQLFLRKHLNQLHNMFYKPDDSLFPALTNKQPKHFPTIEASQESLDIIDRVAPNMVWDIQNGELASDILGARLRAKYYGAQVITYRPFVLNILEMSSAPSTSTEQVSNDFIDGVQAPRVSRDATTWEDVPEKVREYARNGLQATIHSTRAFYGLGDPGTHRLIVTNIWGTAHAQWGNLLVLQAAWKNRILRRILDDLISTEELIYLLEKTLALLKLVATPTSALALDYMILKRAGMNNGLLASPQGPNTSSSFSSTATADAPMGAH